MEGIKKRLRDDPVTRNAIAGGLAGAVTSVVVCPLDVLKTRLQVQSRSSSAAAAGIRGGLSRILALEGIPGLYRGLTPTLVALLPNWAVYFTVYERLKVALAAREGRPSARVHMAAAAGAGAATMLVTNPLWVIKTRLQTQGLGLGAGAQPRRALYRGLGDAAVRIAREEGLAGLYSGLGPSLLGVLHVVIQFPLYEALKRTLGQQRAERSRRRGEPVSSAHAPPLSALDLMLASASAKMVASTATYPHEVIRSRMHISGVGAFRGFLSTCRAVHLEDGLAGFYRGCMTNLVRTTPAAAVTFTSFELVSRALATWCGDLEGEGGGGGGDAPVARAAAAAAGVEMDRAAPEASGVLAHPAASSVRGVLAPLLWGGDWWTQAGT